VEHLLGTQLGRLCVEPGLAEQLGNPLARQARQVDATATGTGSICPGIGINAVSGMGGI